MAWEPIRVLPISMPSAGTLTSFVDVKQYYQNIYLVLPTFASASDWYVQGCETATGTFRRLKVPVNAANTATVAVNTFVVASGVSNALVPIPAQGIRYLKIEASTAPADGVQLKLICGG